MSRPSTADPRAELVDWDVIDLRQVPPVEEWADEDWEDAILGTLAVQSRQRREAGLDGPGITLEEYIETRGIKLDS